MNRRGFLGLLIGGVAATAAVRTWPFRVYSFPTEVVALNGVPLNYVPSTFPELLAPGLRNIFQSWIAIRTKLPYSLDPPVGEWP
jgi:hypothetical protein